MAKPLNSDLALRARVLMLELKIREICLSATFPSSVETRTSDGSELKTSINMFSVGLDKSDIVNEPEPPFSEKYCIVDYTFTSILVNIFASFGNNQNEIAAIIIPIKIPRIIIPTCLLYHGSCT